MNADSTHDILVRSEVDGDGVAVVRLDNPPVNSMSDPLLDALDAALAALQEGPQVRVLVVTGEGEKAFAAGADLPTFRQLIDDPAEIAAHTSRTRTVISRLEAMPVPTIAAIGASAVGGGLELALGCDLAVADERAKLGLPEVGLGLIPGAGGTQRLTRRIGPMRATKMILGGLLLDTHEALEAGIIGAIAPPGGALEESLTLARAFAAKPRVAVQQALRAIRSGRGLGLQEGLDLEHEAFLKVLATDDAREGIEAFIARRKPQFRHR